MKHLRVKKLTFYLVLGFLMFAVFNIFAFIILFIPTYKNQIAYANDTGTGDCGFLSGSVDSPDTNCCDPLGYSDKGKYKKCVDAYAGALGVTVSGEEVCPDSAWDDAFDTSPVCNDSRFARVCVQSCTIRWGLSAQTCSNAYHCAVFPEYASQYYDQDMQELKDNCIDQLNSCYYTYVADSLSTGQEAPNALDDCIQTKMYTFPLTDPGNQACTQDVVDDWKNKLPPLDSTDSVMSLCDSGCRDQCLVSKGISYDKCVTDCHGYVGSGGVNQGDVIQYLRTLCVTPEGVDHEAEATNPTVAALDALAEAIGRWKEGDSLQKLLGKLGECIFPELKPFCSNGGGQYAVAKYAQDVFSAGQVLFGALAMLKIIFGGVMYATAAGNPSQIQAAKEHIKYALIGIVLLLSINIILQLVGAGGYLL